MTKLFEEQRFEALDDSGSGRVYEGLEFHRCYFQGCFTVAKKPKHRVTFRNVVLLNCEVRGCTLRGAIVEDSVVQGLKTNGLLQTWGAVFKHVVLRGKIGDVMASHLIGVSARVAKAQPIFDKANAAFYASVDWALDISQAVFASEPDFRGVPGRLIRRDPETQVLITRERTLQSAWKDLELPGTWRVALEWFQDRGRPDEVLVAPKGAPDFQDLLAGLKLLREAGVAEPG